MSYPFNCCLYSFNSCGYELSYFGHKILIEYAFHFQFFLQVAECCGYPLKCSRFLIEQSVHKLNINVHFFHV